jgi:hypothetical protein
MSDSDSKRVTVAGGVEPETPTRSRTSAACPGRPAGVRLGYGRIMTPGLRTIIATGKPETRRSSSPPPGPGAAAAGQTVERSQAHTGPGHVASATDRPGRRLAWRRNFGLGMPT